MARRRIPEKVRLAVPNVSSSTLHRLVMLIEKHGNTMRPKRYVEVLRADHKLVSAPTVSKVAAEMGVFFKRGLNQQVLSKATELIRQNRFSDEKISRLLKKQGLKISYKTVGKVRNGLGLKSAGSVNDSRRASVVIVEAVRQLVGTGKYSNIQISRMLKSAGMAVSNSTVRSIRASLLSGESHYKPSNGQNLDNIKTYKKVFGSFSEAEIARKWGSLNKEKKRLAGEFMAAKGLKKRIELLDRRAEVEMQLQAVYPMVPKSLKQASISEMSNQIVSMNSRSKR